LTAFPRVVAARSNPGLELANPFGVENFLRKTRFCDLATQWIFSDRDTINLCNVKSNSKQTRYTPATVPAKAIVREPGRNFSGGETSVDLGRPDHALALRQHEAYCHALQSCGIELIRLPPDVRYPDSTFVEDTAIVTERGAVITRPGAESRRGEIDDIRRELLNHYSDVKSITAPGTVDGGDVCSAGDHYFIGLSRRTNETGAAQLAQILAGFGYSSSLIDIRGLGNILHLKSGMACVGPNRLVVIEALSRRKEFSTYELVHVNSPEEYAANCLWINNRILVAAGFPGTKRQFDDLNYQTIALEMSEFQKMDGGLSCLSLRF
jgi:dimethylargininase